MRQLEISIMIVSYRAPNARRHINGAACTQLRNSLIVIFSLLLVGNQNICVESKVDLYEFRAFADFLAQQHLKHAIIAYNGASLKSSQQQFEKNDALRTLFNVTALRFYDVQHAAKNSQNFTNFKNLFFCNSPRVGIYLTHLEDVLLQEHVLGLKYDPNAVIVISGNTFLRFNYSQAWFIMSQKDSVEAALANIREVMTPLSINISADITMGVRSESNHTIQIFDIYKIQPIFLDIEEKGYWSPTEGFQLKKRFHQSFVRRRRDFKGLQIRSGIVIREKPDDVSEYDYLHKPIYKKRDVMQRKPNQMLMMLEPMFNFSFRNTLTPFWGTLWPNGSWDGVMAMLLSGEAELSTCPMRFGEQRSKVVQYTPPIHTEYVYFIFRHPRRNRIRNIFLEPFVEEVWYAVTGVIIVTTLLLLLHLHHEYRFFLNKEPHFQFRFDYAFLSIMEAFFMQGPDQSAFAATSTRILIFFVCLFSMMLQQFYGAFIVGSLLSVAPRTITDMDELYNSSLEIGMENIPYNFDFFENATSTVAKALYTSKICKNRERHILSIMEGAERIKKGGFAFHVSANRMYGVLKDILTEQEFCDLQEVSFNSPFHLGIAIRKLSPFRDFFSSAILTLRTSGLMRHSDIEWQTPQLDCSLIQNTEVEVDLQHFLPAIFLLCSGMVLSVGILVIEIAYFNLKRDFNLERFCPCLLSDLKIEFTN